MKEKSMRYITTFGMVALTAALWGTTATAQQAPSGSYQQTCQNIEVRGSTLYANCKTVNGGWQNTQLRDYQRCNGQIDNQNGNLQCTGGNGGYNGPNQGGNYGNGRDDRDRDANRDRDRDGDRNGNQGYNNQGYNKQGYNNGSYGPNGAPNGSYLQTCQNVQMAGNTLRASCQKRNGKSKNTSLSNPNQCNGDIQNDNGKLRCR
jgi:hypothetical protein